MKWCHHPCQFSYQSDSIWDLSIGICRAAQRVNEQRVPSAKFIKRRTKQLQHCSCPPCTHTPYTQFIQYKRPRMTWRHTCAACTRLSSNSVSPSIVSIDLTDSLDFISRSLGFDSLDWEYSESPTSSLPVLFCLLLSLSASTETSESWMNTHRPQHSWERCSCWEPTNDNVSKPNAKQACCYQYRKIW